MSMVITYSEVPTDYGNRLKFMNELPQELKVILKQFPAKKNLIVHKVNEVRDIIMNTFSALKDVNWVSTVFVTLGVFH